MVYTRSEGTGCPYCTGRKVTPKQGGLVKQFPLLAAEWDVEKNTPLTPQDVTTGSHKLIWWRCPKGHNYQTSVKLRARSAAAAPSAQAERNAKRCKPSPWRRAKYKENF